MKRRFANWLRRVADKIYKQTKGTPYRDGRTSHHGINKFGKRY